MVMCLKTTVIKLVKLLILVLLRFFYAVRLICHVDLYTNILISWLWGLLAAGGRPFNGLRRSVLSSSRLYNSERVLYQV